MYYGNNLFIDSISEITVLEDERHGLGKVNGRQKPIWALLRSWDTGFKKYCAVTVFP